MHAAFHKPEARAFIGVKFAEQPQSRTQFGLYRCVCANPGGLHSVSNRCVLIHPGRGWVCSGYYGIDAEALAGAGHPRLRELAERERALRARWQEPEPGAKL